jgi:hypothetical protein
LYGWFPSTPDNPQSAVTISTLKLFHAVSLQGKTMVYHFFNALMKITDNMGSKAFKVFIFFSATGLMLISKHSVVIRCFSALCASGAICVP